MMASLRRHLGEGLLLLSFAVVGLHAPARAETPAPSIHWGALGYPDQFPTLTVGFTINRFTEFDNPTRQSVPYDSTIHESFGLNFITGSWTHELSNLPGWSLNLTGGIGPTAEQPSKFLQNSVIHKVMGIPPVGTKTIREDTDAMIDGSVTRWLPFFSQDKTLFVGAGGSAGTLYQELFVRGGVRRADVPYLSDWIRGKDMDWIRWSMMARAGQVFHGAVLHATNKASVIWQPSVSFGPYCGNGQSLPRWELELGLTWDSGIFVNDVGQSHKEKFWTIAYRYGPGRFETWNDSFVGNKDRGPTYGATMTINLLDESLAGLWPHLF
jgi:hypothetical protein